MQTEMMSRAALTEVGRVRTLEIKSKNSCKICGIVGGSSQIANHENDSLILDVVCPTCFMNQFTFKQRNIVYLTFFSVQDECQDNGRNLVGRNSLGVDETRLQRAFNAAQFRALVFIGLVKRSSSFSSVKP